MKKQELEQLLKQRNQDISQLHAKVFQLQKQLEQAQITAEQKVQKTQQSTLKLQYEAWKSVNEPFLSMFIKEAILKLSVETECNYGGSIETRLFYDKEQISESTDSVVMHHNGLDE